MWLYDKVGNVASKADIVFVVKPWYANGVPERGFLLQDRSVTVVGDEKAYKSYAPFQLARCSGLGEALAKLRRAISEAASVATSRIEEHIDPEPGKPTEINLCTDSIAYEISLPGITLHGSSCLLQFSGPPKVNDPFVQPALNFLELASSCVSS